MMKRKSLITIFATLTLLVFAVSAFTACAKTEKTVVGNEYTVTFDSKGGSAVKPVKANAGATITAPTAPTKDGFVLRAGTKARTAE